jgi:excisionase family DNA binding protein
MATLMNVSQVAHYLGVPTSFVYARTRRNARERIPHVKLGKYVRFDPTQLSRWISRHERGRTRRKRRDSQRS